jgi:catechol 2,3-dioxygenase-like lactoylglutathione lyase family enzyme
MPVKRLEHVNIHTANVDGLIEWYGRVLEMKPGWRPPFKFPGAWLYAGDQPAIHIVGLDNQPKTSGLQIEHFAFSATGLKEFMGRLEQSKERFDARRVPGTDEVQVNIWDPDGNHIHIDFPPDEAVGVDVPGVTIDVMKR